MRFGPLFEGLSRAERRSGVVGLLLIAWTVGWLAFIAYQGIRATGGLP